MIEARKETRAHVWDLGWPRARGVGSGEDLIELELRLFTLNLADYFLRAREDVGIGISFLAVKPMFSGRIHKIKQENEKSTVVRPVLK